MNDVKDKKKKVKLPKSVKELKWSRKKFAKANNIPYKEKGQSKKEAKYNKKILEKEYAEFILNGLNKAVKILSEVNDESKKIIKVKESIEEIITDNSLIKRIGKIYSKNKDAYPNLIYFPYMILNTIIYYNQEELDEEEKKQGEELDAEQLIEFCETILKKEIKRYIKAGLPVDIAFQLAAVVPSTKVFKTVKGYKRFIHAIYKIAEKNDLNINDIFEGIYKLDKDIKRKKFLEGFYSEFIMTKFSNKSYNYTDTQKTLNEELISQTLNYLNTIKTSKLRDILKSYIKRRKKAEEFKNDSKRIIKFIDHANSNSPYTNIKTVVEELIADNSNNELYLS